MLEEKESRREEVGLFMKYLNSLSLFLFYGYLNFLIFQFPFYCNFIINKSEGKALYLHTY